MAKIAFLGAGSLGFGRRLVSDILSFPELADGTIHLMDPSAERLGFIHNLSERMVAAAGLPTSIESSTEREAALDGADYVIASIRVGEGMGPEALDVRIPYEAGGLRQTVSDTIGVGGIMKGLRTIPAMLDIAYDMERLCRSALLLNYTNPMSMIMWAISEATSITSIGLCHSVQNTARQLAGYMDVDLDTLTDVVAATAQPGLVGDAVAELLRRGLLVEHDAGYAFTYDQVRRAVVEALDPQDRADLHGRVADAVSRHHPDRVEDLARHLDAA
ncbi:MAG: hypothetical protein ABGY41_03015, partial [Candidatus Poribacteria bacterium]